jgi:anti-sigma factor (TIGR02949 family)
MKHNHDLRCEDLLGNLSNFIDGELDEGLCDQLRQHMVGCEDCRVVFDTTTRTIYLYQTTAMRPDLPNDVRERLFDKLNLDDLKNKNA